MQHRLQSSMIGGSHEEPHSLGRAPGAFTRELSGVNHDPFDMLHTHPTRCCVSYAYIRIYVRRLSISIALSYLHGLLNANIFTYLDMYIYICLFIYLFIYSFIFINSLSYHELSGYLKYLQMISVQKSHCS